MYYIGEFCRVCLGADKPLVNILQNDLRQITLISKLELCVSEVKWNGTESVMMCDRCIERLNSAFEFKRQCLKSAEKWNTYTKQLNEAQENKVFSQVYVSLSRNDVKQELVDEYVKFQNEESKKAKPTIRVKTAQQLYPPLPNIILTTNNTTSSNTFQNVFINLIPSTAIKYQPPNLAFVNKINTNNVKLPQPQLVRPQIKETNQNMFLNINNTLHKILPIVTTSKDLKPTAIQIPSITPLSPLSPILQKSVELGKDVVKSLTNSKSEELSVEIDPTCFESDEEGHLSEGNSNIAKDWEELISTNKIPSELSKINMKKSNIPVPALVKLADATPLHVPVGIRMTTNTNNVDPLTCTAQSIPTDNFLGIKPDFKITPEMEEQMIEFLNVDHFMAPKADGESLPNYTVRYFTCEQCGHVCETIKSLKYHIKQFHLGKFLHKCKFCWSEYPLKAQFDAHMQKHALELAEEGFAKETITLADLSTQNESVLFPQINLYGSLNTNNPAVVEPPQPVEEIVEDNALKVRYKCDLCRKSFVNYQGLQHHKIKKHDTAPQVRKKYFIKGMKNAKCDICNREFSTQSYLQLHIKLHFRKNDYRLKVFNKEKYLEKLEEDLKDDDSEKAKEQQAISIDATPIDEFKSQLEFEDIDLFDIRESSLKSPESNVKSSEGSEQSPESLKIKINLRNINRNSTEKDETNSNEESAPYEDKALICPITGNLIPIETDMQVDEEEKCVNGNDNDNGNSDEPMEEEEKDDDMVPSDLEATPTISVDVNMECSVNKELASSKAELSEDDSAQDETLHNEAQILSAKTVDGKQQCTFCNRLFCRKHDLKRHLNNIHLKAIQYLCHLCQSQFYEAFHLTRHLRQHNSFMRCGSCMKTFSGLRDLKLHIISAHANCAEYQCGTCGDTYDRPKPLREHMYEHYKSIVYICHYCNEQFKESRDLSKHLIEHSGMYACNICNTTFTAEKELIHHSKCHTSSAAERKYECEICHSRYKKKRYLLAHITKAHSNKTHPHDLINRVDLSCKSS